ncbi:MAG: phosphomannomutase/phosphoglucomutase [Syntrophales bacterium]|jgi:phosphomannomutase/phosphoglucomutase|nr:phosphomannomutase/phosphoglucomutase [Syntrophales bacterium]
MNPEVFREYDIRGIVGKDLTPDFVVDLGKAIGSFAAARGARTMTLGRDCRLSSESYSEAVQQGLVAAGMQVVDIGLCATPMLYFSIRHLGADGGVMITGSHNPPDFNGFKVCVGPDTIYGDDIQELCRIMQANAYRSAPGSTSREDVTQAYQDYLFHNVQVRPGLSIAVDAGNGVGGLYSLPIFRRFGCRITEIYCEPDGRFPNHFPDPTVPANLKELIRCVKDTGADVGLAFDGDADRLGLITDRGDILWGDEILLLFSRFILRENPGAAIIGEVKCSQNLYDDIARHGGHPIMWKAGHSLIKGKMKEEKALLAGEMSGHLFFADRYFGFDDAIYSAIRVLEILSLSGQKLSEILADVPKTCTTPEIRVACPDAVKFQVVEEVKNFFRPKYPIIDIDGVRVPFGDGWGLLRPSNTQPVLVLRFEARTPERLAAIRKEIEDVLTATVKKHGVACP